MKEKWEYGMFQRFETHESTMPKKPKDKIEHSKTFPKKPYLKAEVVFI